MIFYSPYELKRKVKPNKVVSNLIQKGALIKVTDYNGNFGVADLCPWPELGDLTLEQELELNGPLFQRAYELANLDLEVRKNKIKLVQNLSVKNHQTVSDYKLFSPDKSVSKILKIKGDQNISDLADFLNHLNDFQIRLDFNSTLTLENFKNFISLISADTLRKIEVIEDPFPFDEIEWKKWDQIVPLALDFNQKNNQWYRRIGKPARDHVDQPFYLTSNMDHPVGLVHGLLEAQKYPNSSHGFLTLDHYEETPFHKYFQQNQDRLNYNSDDYGIGFSQELSKLNWVPMIHWKDPAQENYLGVNPQSSLNEKDDLLKMSHFFSKNISKTGYLLIPSSGTSKANNESVKLIAIKKESFLSNAKMMIKHFNLQDSKNWGCVLPLFHVGGLAILARSFLTNSKIYLSHWNQTAVDWISEKNIQYLSLVPTQIFDLIQWQIKCPRSVEKVFVGGAALTEQHYKDIQKLGWPVTLTYGMTETSSMFAYQKSEYGIYSLIEGHQLIQNKYLSNSMASFSLQIINQEIHCHKIDFDLGYPIPDQIEFIDEKHFKVLGRQSNYIKILGEGVSMDLLQSIADQISYQKMIVMPKPHDRNGFEIIAIFENQIDEMIIQKFNQMVRPFERIFNSYTVDHFPRTALGKIKKNELLNDIKKG